MLISSIICHSLLLVSFPETAANNILRTSSVLCIKPSDLLRVNDTKQVRLIGIYNGLGVPIRCHRESLQDSTTFHFAGSHNGNGIWKTDWTGMLSYE